jgi:hypothetical protein
LKDSGDFPESEEGEKFRGIVEQIEALLPA